MCFRFLAFSTLHADVAALWQVSPGPQALSSADHGPSLVGKRVEILQPDIDAYYGGDVLDFDRSTSRHTIVQWRKLV